MVDNPVELDEHRGMAAQKATVSRRQRIQELQGQQAALQRHLEEFEQLLAAGPAKTWLEAAAKSRYLIELYAKTPSAQDPRRKELIALALDDLKRLSNQNKDNS